MFMVLPSCLSAVALCRGAPSNSRKSLILCVLVQSYVTSLRAMITIQITELKQYYMVRLCNFLVLTQGGSKVMRVFALMCLLLLTSSVTKTNVCILD